MSYTSAESKLRLLASQNATLQADLGGANPATFRWMDQQLLQNKIGTLLASGCCVRVRRRGTTRNNNQSGIMNLCKVRLLIDVLSLSAENARSVANDVINFLGTVNLCSGGQFNSPITTATQVPNFIEGQWDFMEANPQSTAGPVYGQHIAVSVFNREDIFVAA